MEKKSPTLAKTSEDVNTSNDGQDTYRNGMITQCVRIVHSSYSVYIILLFVIHC